jgi:multidrug efflux pump subunit AcrA (membrane-fusion protein)
VGQNIIIFDFSGSDGLTFAAYAVKKLPCSAPKTGNKGRCVSRTKAEVSRTKAEAKAEAQAQRLLAKEQARAKKASDPEAIAAQTAIYAARARARAAAKAEIRAEKMEAAIEARAAYEIAQRPTPFKRHNLTPEQWAADIEWHHKRIRDQARAEITPLWADGK